MQLLEPQLPLIAPIYKRISWGFWTRLWRLGQGKLGYCPRVSDPRNWFSPIRIQEGWPDVADTCHLAISTTETLILTRQQVRSALDTLMSLCVVYPGQGGRAYYGPQPAFSSRDRSKTTNVTGKLTICGKVGVLDNADLITDAYALPPRANIAIFA